jgi:enterochelin esterase family protein
MRIHSNNSFLLLVVCIALFLSPAQAQKNTSPKPDSYSHFTRMMYRLDSLANIKDPVQRKKQIDTFWATLVKKNQIPLVVNDSVAFLYKGEADSVFWQGDFNGWGSLAGGHIFNNRGYRVGNSDVWRMKAAFPPNARIDYKIVLNGRTWITDPVNPNQQWGGSGPNSELRMPEWKPEAVSLSRKEIAKGKLSENFPAKSESMGYFIQYKVYTPANYDKLSELPVIYVTDGQEYADDKMGSMVHMLDNLIADKVIKPVIAVFIDPRESGNAGNNRRMFELPLNDKFVDFITNELIPAVDASYKTKASADARAILGTSLGGLNAAYVGIKASDKISLIGIHSPSFWYRPQIYSMFENSPTLPLKIFMSTGVISDTEEGARRMKAIMEKKQYMLEYREINEGHSWGNWRSLIDDILIYFFANN